MNSFDPVNPALVDQPPPPARDGHTGYPEALRMGDTRDVLKSVCGSASRDFPKALWIEPKDWANKARENDANKTWPVNYCDRYTHQGGSHECTSHSLSRNFEICRNRQRGFKYPDGPKAGFRYPESATANSVWVSPISIYAEANPGQWGGASIREVMNICIRRGFLPDKVQPKDYGFKHSLHTSAGGTDGFNHSAGPWVRVSNFPAGWQETAKHFRVLEVIFPESAEQMMCLVLHGYAVCVGRNGHAVPLALANVDQKAIGYVDSYNRILYDSWRTVNNSVGGAYAIASVTTPSDWLKPAG